MFAAMSRTRYYLVILLCCILGTIVSILALQHHYRRDASSFCNINATFNCDVVNRSAYSEIAGIPVALLGLMAYLFMLGLCVFQQKKIETPAFLLFLSLAGLVFSLYLTYLEAQVLRTWCVLCLTSLASIAMIAVLSALRVRSEQGGARS
jgi:uncharacterized membrane protein